MENNEIFLGKNPDQQIPREIIDTEFQVPTTEVELPSQGILYATGQKKVKIKYLTASEDDILFSPDLIKAGKSLDMLLQKAVVDKNVNPDDLLIGDRNAILVALRRTGLGDEFTSASVLCPSCEESFEPTVDLSKFGLKKLELVPDSDGYFDYILPTMNKRIKFRMLTGKDENRLAKSLTTSKKLTSNKPGAHIVNKIMTERYLLQIMEVEGKTDKLLIQKLIECMPMRDSTAFREYVKLAEPNIDTKCDVECKHCGHTFEEQINLDYRLFYPSLK